MPPACGLDGRRKERLREAGTNGQASRKSERKNAPWTRIGAQWPTKNGEGHRQVLDMVPMAAGSIVVLPNEPKSDDPEEGA